MATVGVKGLIMLPQICSVRLYDDYIQFSYTAVS